MRIYNKLPVMNIIRRPKRSAALIILVTVLAFIIFGGMMLSKSLENGLDSLGNRLGAQIMVVPEEAAEDAGLEDIVLQGNTGYFYMSDTKLDEVAAIEGVGQTSSQLFLASLAASCCSAKVQLIGFDPETDFAIQAWIRSTYDGTLGPMEIVVGNDIISDEGEKLSFYSDECTVVAKLAKTGTNYDRCVFASWETIEALTASSLGKQLNNFKDIDPAHVLSCILVNVEEGYDIDTVVGKINQEVDEVTAIRTRNMVSDIASGLSGFSGVLKVVMAAAFIVAIVLMAIAFTMILNERKKEFAVLRVMGASGKSIVKSVWTEIFLLCLTGGVAGSLAALLITSLFGNAIRTSLELPMLMPQASFAVMLFAVTIAAVIIAGLLASLAGVIRTGKAEPSLLLREEY